MAPPPPNSPLLPLPPPLPPPAPPAPPPPAVSACGAAAAAHEASWRSPLELTLLGAIWGGSFLFMRVAAADFGPFPLFEARRGLVSLVLLPLLWAARAQFTPSLWLRIAGIAAINSVIPFALFAWGAERAPAGIGAITNAMTVMFTALVAFLFFGERIGPRRLIGLVFFFQAEDGIRDYKVTGVQTCALPIYANGGRPAPVACLAGCRAGRRCLPRLSGGAGA